MTAPDLARLAGLLADETRAAICLALLGGQAWTAGELARHAGVAPATATGHLHKLVRGGLLTERRQGRHRYVQLAGPQVAQLVEDLAAHAGPGGAPAARGLRAVTASAALARGRTCYDHLAGRLGVAVTDALSRTGRLDTTAGFALTAAGRDWLAALAPALPPPDGRAVFQPDGRASRRPLARGCLDWTERREHLAGVAGAQICRIVLDRGWVARVGTGRAVRVTPAGSRALTAELGADPAWA